MYLRRGCDQEQGLDLRGVACVVRDVSWQVLRGAHLRRQLAKVGNSRLCRQQA